MPPFFALSETDQPTLVFWVIAALIALGPAIHSWIKVIQYFLGKKEDLSQFVTRTELATVKAARDKQISETLSAIRQDMSEFKRELKDDIQSFETKATELQKEMMSLHRSLGRVEGHDDSEMKSARRPR